jgi:uncharacterized paraquat-inducible protein A
MILAFHNKLTRLVRAQTTKGQSCSPATRQPLATACHAARCPKGKRTLLLGLSTMAMVALLAALSLPFLASDFALNLPPWLPDRIAREMNNLVIDRGAIPIGEKYLLGIIGDLLQAQEYVIGAAIILFSLALPGMKVAMLLHVGSKGPEIDQKRVALLHAISRWSMADVFIVGLIIVFIKAEGFHFHMAAGPGLYAYALSTVLAAVAITMIGKVQAKAIVDDNSGFPAQQHIHKED